MVYSVRVVGRSVVKLPVPWYLHRRHRPTEVDKDVRSSGTSKVFTIFTDPTIMHLVYPPKLCITISLGTTAMPWRIWKQWLCKILRGKQGALWYVYMKVVITRHVKRA